MAKVINIIPLHSYRPGARQLVNYDSWVFNWGLVRAFFLTPENFQAPTDQVLPGSFSFFGIFGTSNGDFGAYLPTMLSTWERHVYVAMFAAAVATILILMAL